MHAAAAAFVLLFASPLLLAQAPAAAGAQAPCHADTRPPSAADMARYRQDYGLAAKLYSKAMDANSRDPEARAGLIETRMDDGHFREARDMADRLMAEQPAEVLSYITHADVLASQLQLDAATADIRKALAMDHCNGRAYYVASVIEGHNEKNSLAWSHLQLAHRLSPNDDEVTRSWLWAKPSADKYPDLEQYAATTGYLKAADLEDFKSNILESRAAAASTCTVVAPTGGTTVPLQHASDSGWLQAEVGLGDKKRNFGIAANGNGITLYEDTAKLLGLPVGEHFNARSLYRAGHFRYWLTTLPSLRVGTVEFRNCAITVQEGTSGSGFGIIGLGFFRDFLVDFDPAGSLTLSKLPALPPGTANAGEKWSVVTDSPSGTRSRAQGIWQPLDAVVPQGMETWGRIYNISGIKAVLTQIGPSAPVATELAWQQHVETLNYNHTKDAASLADTARALGKPLPKSAMDAMDGAPYFAGIQGHILPVKSWDAEDYDPFSKAHGTDLAGTLSYRVLGGLRMAVDFRDGLVTFTRTTTKRFAGF